MFQLAGWPKLESDCPLLKGRNLLKLFESKRFKKQKLNMSLQSTPPFAEQEKLTKGHSWIATFNKKNHLSFFMFFVHFCLVFNSWPWSMCDRRPTRPTKAFSGRSSHLAAGPKTYSDKAKSCRFTAQHGPPKYPPLCGAKKVNKMTFSSSKFRQKITTDIFQFLPGF